MRDLDTMTYFLFVFFFSKNYLFLLVVLQFTGYYVFTWDADCLAGYLKRIRIFMHRQSYYNHVILCKCSYIVCDYINNISFTRLANQ